MAKTELTAEQARAIAARFLELSAELSCDSHDWRCKVLGEFAWHSRFEIAAAMEQLAQLLERDAWSSVTQGTREHELAAERETKRARTHLDFISESIIELCHNDLKREHLLTAVGATFEDLRERGERIATLERKLAAAKADAQRHGGNEDGKSRLQ